MAKKRVDPMLAKLRLAKKAGIPRAEAQDIIEKATRTAAKRDGWRNSELAMTLSSNRLLLDEVYGKEETCS